MTKKLVAFALLITLVGFGIQGIQNLTKPESEKMEGCIQVLYKNNTQSKDQCIDAVTYMDATTVLSKAGYKLEGTDKYPTEIICRVNNFPTPEMEPCKNMPPADAYWAIIVKQKGHWDWAKLGITQFTLRPGQGIGLVYVIDGKLDFPSK